MYVILSMQVIIFVLNNFVTLFFFEVNFVLEAIGFVAENAKRFMIQVAKKIF